MQSRKKILNIIASVVVIFTFSNIEAFSQSYMYYSGGYGFSNVNLDGLNYVINSYNDQRTHLTRDLGEINLMNGFAVSGGMIISEKLLLEIGFTQRKGYSYSDETLEGDQPYKRDFIVNATTIGGGAGYYVIWREGFKLLLGSTVEFGKINTRTRLYNTNNENIPGYNDVDNNQPTKNENRLIGISPYFQFSYSPWGKNFEFVLRPYYQVQIRESDFAYVNQALNPHTYEQDPPDATKSFANNFGIQLKLNVLMEIGL